MKCPKHPDTEMTAATVSYMPANFRPGDPKALTYTDPLIRRDVLICYDCAGGTTGPDLCELLPDLRQAEPGIIVEIFDR